jgi:hypothetical protein
MVSIAVIVKDQRHARPETNLLSYHMWKKGQVYARGKLHLTDACPLQAAVKLHFTESCTLTILVNLSDVAKHEVYVRSCSTLC